ncbi:unnamed protein product, partial [Rotaria sp. Silwood2]
MPLDANKPYVYNSFIKKITYGVDWWILMGEFVEDYGFKWESSGHYTIGSSNGIKYMERDKNQSYSINRDQLVKYPALLKRFDDIAPRAVFPIIYYKLCDNSYHLKNYEDTIQTIYKLFDPSYNGQSVHPSEYNKIHVRYVNDLPLNETSGTKPVHVPESPDWDRVFEDMPDHWIKSYKEYSIYQKNKTNRPADELQQLKQIYFSKSGYIDMYVNFIIDWPVEEMMDIIDDYYAYEKGEIPKSPKEKIDSAATNVEKYAKNDKDAEPYMAPFNTKLSKNYNNYSTSADAEKVSGTVDGDGMLYGKGIATINGKEYTFTINTSNGEFTTALPLSMGENTITLTIGNQKKEIIITRKEKSKNPPVPMRNSDGTYSYFDENKRDVFGKKFPTAYLFNYGFAIVGMSLFDEYNIINLDGELLLSSNHHGISQYNYSEFTEQSKAAGFFNISDKGRFLEKLQMYNYGLYDAKL